MVATSSGACSGIRGAQRQSVRTGGRKIRFSRHGTGGVINRRGGASWVPNVQRERWKLSWMRRSAAPQAGDERWGRLRGDHASIEAHAAACAQKFSPEQYHTDHAMNLLAAWFQLVASPGSLEFKAHQHKGEPGASQLGANAAIINSASMQAIVNDHVGDRVEHQLVGTSLPIQWAVGVNAGSRWAKPDRDEGTGLRQASITAR